jgi:molybdate transport system regulatory protein
MPSRLTLRIDLGPGRAVGHGKIRLLEAIAEQGSISSAGRALGMSYKRAWDLVAALNACFREPVVATQAGGSRGGGAELTPMGRRLVDLYRGMEADATRAAQAGLQEMEAALSREGNDEC